MQFARKKLIGRLYSVAKVLPTTKQVKIIDKKEFTKTALDKNIQAFMMHVTSLSLTSMPIHPAWKA